MCIILSVRGYCYAPGPWSVSLRLTQAQWISPLAAGSQGVMNSCHSATSSRLTTKMVLVRLEQPPCL